MVGDTYLLSDADYRYGLGPLLCRVTQVLMPVDYGEDGRVEIWWEVEAMCKPPGTVGPAQTRQLYVRAAGISNARRKAGQESRW